MPPNVYFDNNFFNFKLIQRNQQSLAQHFISAGLQWCFSEELLLELFNSIQKRNIEKQQMMTCWASFCLSLWPNSKVLRNSSQIVLEEIEGRIPKKFAEEENINLVKEILGDLSMGTVPSNISLAWERMREVKNSDEQFLLEIQDFRQKGTKDLSWEEFSMILLKKILSVNSSQDPGKKSMEIISNLSLFPHTRTFLFVAHTLSYTRTGKRHLFDQRHLVYATGMDYFVTDDGPTVTLANRIFQGRPDVITQQEFFTRCQSKK